MTNPKTPKKPYQRPKLKKFGSVKDLTKTSSKGGAGDGGAAPFDRMGTGGGMGCVSSPHWIDEHRILVSDQTCQKAYQLAIEKFVTPESVVVDLGAGSAIHTLFALRAGAKKVYVIESGAAMGMAREIIAQNGFLDRVELIHADSRAVNLPEKADVLISNIGFLYSAKTLPDAAARFLKPGGKMIPTHAVLNLVPYTDASYYQSHIQMWRSNPFGFDMSAASRLAVHHPHYFHLQPENFLGDSYRLTPTNFRQATCQRVQGSHTVPINRDGVIHGIGGWYEFYVGEDRLFSTQPPMALNKELWTNFFLPLENPIQVGKGQQIQIDIQVDFASLPETSIWSWSVAGDGLIRQAQNSFFSFSEIADHQ